MKDPAGASPDPLSVCGDRLLVAEAVDALSRPGQRAGDAVDHVPKRPGLYAIDADAGVWDVLDLGAAPDARPLYVGKAEASLHSRDLQVHFRTGKTGWSTVRRSLAARLRELLDLVACPRNKSKPGNFANFGLEPAGDERLTDWMCTHLTLSTWSWPAPDGVKLADVETDVLRRLLPPLNIDKVITPWRADLKAARAVLAAEARRWRPGG